MAVPGFDGVLDSRILSWREARVLSHGTSEEVPAWSMKSCSSARPRRAPSDRDGMIAAFTNPVSDERGRERRVRLRNGFWIDERGPCAQSVSGVVTGFGILPGGEFANRRPRLWPNPWATSPLAESLQIPVSAGSTDAHSSNIKTTSKAFTASCSDLARTGPVPSRHSSTDTVLHLQPSGHGPTP
jgi:hypothetical protein